MVFVTAGMGGGTGTGAAPVIAQLAREEGALTVGVVTKPFVFEGKQRARRAELGLAQLAEHVDTLITIPNQKLLTLADDDLTFVDAFRKADEVLFQAVKGISDLITQNGIVNVDFADVKTVMSNMGRALMGTGCAKGEGRARLAAEMADQLAAARRHLGRGRDRRPHQHRRRPRHEDAARSRRPRRSSRSRRTRTRTSSSAPPSTRTWATTIKVTVIATGFDHVVAEVPQQLASAAPPRATAHSHRRVAAPRAAPHVGPLRPGARLRDAAPAAPSRRGRVPEPPRRPAPQVAVGAAAAAGPRERASFVPPLDSEWDTPAFQRRGQ